MTTRRSFILGSMAAPWPLVARAQQPPVVGFLSIGSENEFAARIAAFREGLEQQGYTAAQNVTLDYRWTTGRADDLSKHANELVNSRPAVIAATSIAAATAAKKATSSIPIVFFVGSDPIRLGLVSNLGHPGGNLTGISNFSGELATKRLEFLRQVVPTASVIGVLLDRSAADADTMLSDSEAAAKTLGVSLDVLRAGTEPEIKTAFEEFAKSRVGGVAIPGDLFLTSRSIMLAQLSNQHSIPSAFQFREFAEAGGLLSYGGSFTDMYREVGIYVGRILNGERPGDLPVQQGSKMELIVNLRTAKKLGLDVPLPLLGRADEVIE